MTQPRLSGPKQDDPFEQLLGLEDEFYHDGFKLGQMDGKRAGRVEGRVFGFEKGFEKAILAGRLYGRCGVWISRLRDAPTLRPPEVGAGQTGPTMSRQTSIASDGRHDEEQRPPSVPHLPDNARLARHIQTLHDLVDPDSLALENNEEAISDLDDRLRHAEAKIRIIQRIVGESVMEDESQLGRAKLVDGREVDFTDSAVVHDHEENIEDIKSLNVRR